MRKIGGICKHINAVEEYIVHGRKKEPTVIDVKKRKKELKRKGRQITEIEEKEKAYNEILEFVKKNKEVESLVLLKKFGEEHVDDLIRLGELIEENGRIRILE